MGKVQTSCRGSKKQARRWTWTGVCVGQDIQEPQTARGSEGHRRNTDVPQTARASHGRCSDPRARTTDFGKGGVAADIFGHRAHKVGYGKVGNGKDAKE